MRLDRITFATMTWARSEAEDRLLRASLAELARCGRPIMVADGGSGPDFVRFLREVPNVRVVAPECSGVVGQTRSALRAALAWDTDFILYTEADKQAFFADKLQAFVAAMPDGMPFGVGVAARDAASFATFPCAQRTSEGAINALFAREIGAEADFCYGPLILHRDLVPRLDGVDPGLGWGWRFYVMGLAARSGQRIRVFEASLPCPPDQRENDFSERIHRMRQLSQNLQGVILSLQVPLAAP